MALVNEIREALGVAQDHPLPDDVVAALTLDTQSLPTIRTALQRGNLGDAMQRGLGLGMITRRLDDHHPDLAGQVRMTM